MQAADTGSQVCLQGKQAAWDPAWLLSEPMHYSEICQLQFVFVFFSPVEKCAVRNFQRVLPCFAIVFPDENGKKAREPCRVKAQGPGRPSITTGL